MMSEIIEKHKDIARLSPEQLSLWYERLGEIESRVVLIMMIMDKYKRRQGGYSPRTSVAIVFSGVLIMAEFYLCDYSAWGMFAGIVSGLVMYFMVMRFSPVPLNGKEKIIHLLKTAKLPAESELMTLSFSPEESPEFMVKKISEVLIREKGLVRDALNFNFLTGNGS
ncbi:hypothetical protein [Klebsiella michiganensis]|uniref:hypothetical protein n=1 Tax=Klebsiella michiganensis TaxID=1134687 RepID=UPI00111310BA|nr:hypothetical protein [Klebsiella michiganensis]